MKRRFGAEVALKPPRVPYQGVGPQAGQGARPLQEADPAARGQFGDCRVGIAQAEAGTGLEFVNAIKGGVIPGGFIPAVEKGIREAMQHGTVAGYPVKDVSVRLYDGSHHSVDSSEMAFKIAGSMTFKQAMADAGAVLLEPIVQITISCPEDVVGDVIGDLDSRRGAPWGWSPRDR